VPLAVREHGIRRLALEDLATTARVAVPVAHDHAGGDIVGVLGAAYLEAASGLQEGLRTAFDRAPSPREGLERSVRWLLRTLAEDANRTHYCYVDILMGGPRLVGLREQARRGTVAIWQRHHDLAHPRRPLPRSHFELVNSTVVALVARAARDGHVHELPEAADVVLPLIDPVEPAVTPRVAVS
jgi:hypothetical protein